MASTAHQLLRSTPLDGNGPSSHYALGSDDLERARLQRQSDELRGDAAALLNRVTLRPGGRAIDLACGPSGVLELLSKRVATHGSVVGLDRDRDSLTLAGALARERGLANVTLVEGDARDTGLPAASFDLVHARLLLVNVPRPTEVLTEMTRLAKPGGWVAGQEADALWLCEPSHPAWDRLTEVFEENYRHEGADVQIGRRLPRLYRAAGLLDVGFSLRAAHYRRSDARQMLLPDLIRSMRTKIIAREIVSDRELDVLQHDVRAHLNKPCTVTVPHLSFSVWGRIPSH